MTLDGGIAENQRRPRHPNPHLLHQQRRQWKLKARKEEHHLTSGASSNAQQCQQRGSHPTHQWPNDDKCREDLKKSKLITSGALIQSDLGSGQSMNSTVHKVVQKQPIIWMYGRPVDLVGESIRHVDCSRAKGPSSHKLSTDSMEVAHEQLCRKIWKFRLRLHRSTGIE